MPSEQEGDPASQRSLARTGRESQSSSQTAPVIEFAQNSELSASELLGDTEYDWNDPNLVEKMMQDMENGEGQPSSTGRNGTEHDNSANPPQSPPTSGHLQPGNMDFLGRLSLEDARNMGFPPSDERSATEPTVNDAEAARADNSSPRPPTSSVHSALPAADGRGGSSSQPEGNKTTSMSDLPGETEIMQLDNTGVSEASSGSARSHPTPPAAVGRVRSSPQPEENGNHHPGRSRNDFNTTDFEPIDSYSVDDYERDEPNDTPSSSSTPSPQNGGGSSRPGDLEDIMKPSNRYIGGFK